MINQSIITLSKFIANRASKSREEEMRLGPGIIKKYSILLAEGAVEK